MNADLKSVFAWKNIGTLHFDTRLTVTRIDKTAEAILAKIGLWPAPTDLLQLFPEFIGNEDFIGAVLDGDHPEFRLDYINRSDPEGATRYVNLLVLSAGGGGGLVAIEDATEHAVALQQINQQKYELYLYKHDHRFRKRFLSESILGHSPAIETVRQTIHKLSRVPTATVLLQGETGSGKNLAARVIHHSSMPAEAPFVDINCAALPEHLLESELFGYEKGAFTHATNAKPGLFEEAHEGTLFLDEIGELPLNMQAKLLSVLETKRFRRLGSNKPIEITSRIIAATNRDLQAEVEQKTFREDLYYRLNVVRISLPPLRALGDDILLIADHLLKIFNIELKKRVTGFTRQAEQALLAYHWPGNVRELSNCIERAMIFIEKESIDAVDLVIDAGPTRTQTGGQPTWSVPPEGISLEEVERQLIESALALAGKNKSKAARLLGLSRDTLRYRLEKYNLP
jgi:transcriptional regulator with PAS, ATPase and Fis domain